MSENPEGSDVRRYQPGETVPQPGAYSCDGEGAACPHRFSGDVDGAQFPELPEDCTGAGWVRASVA
jgi:hypothetical protein